MKKSNVTRPPKDLKKSSPPKKTQSKSKLPKAPAKTQRVNGSTAHELIVSGIHLELTSALKTHVQEKFERLFRHEERIVRIRVELECDTSQTVANRFSAKGHIEIHGPDMFVTVTSDECHKAVALLVDKLDRMLRRRARYFKVRRHQTNLVDIDGQLPEPAT